MPILRFLLSSSLDAVRRDATWRHDRASYIFQTLSLAELLSAMMKEIGLRYHHPSKNITEIGSIIFDRNSGGALIRLLSFPYFIAVFLVELPILPHQKDA